MNLIFLKANILLNGCPKYILASMVCLLNKFLAFPGSNDRQIEIIFIDIIKFSPNHCK